MNIKKLSGISSLVSRRDARLKDVKRAEKKKQLEFFIGELEKRQLLATFSFDQLTGQLIITSDTADEALTFESFSGDGNYTFTTNADFVSGSPFDDSSNFTLASSNTTLIVNTTATNFTSIQILDGESNTSLSLSQSNGSIGVNFNATFSNATTGTITVANNTSLNNQNLTLVSTNNAVILTGSVNAGSGDVTVSGTAITQSSSITGGSVSLTSGSALALNTISASSLTVSSTGGDITQTGAASVSGASSFTATGNAITVTQSTNDLVGDITASGAAVQITNANATSLGAITASSLTVASTGGDITQTGAASVSGASSFTATGNAITVTNASNDMQGAISVTGDDVSITNANATVLGAVSASSLTVSAGGAVTQSGVATVAVDSCFTASGQTITLDQGSNSLGNVTANGILTISNGNLATLNVIGGNATISGGTIAGLTTTSVALNQSGGTLNGIQINGGTSNLSGGTFNANANVASGSLISNITLGSLDVQSGATANLTGGNVTGATAVYGSLTVGSSAGLNSTLSNNGTTQSAGYIGGTIGVLDGNVTLLNGSNSNSVNVFSGNLYANGLIRGQLYVGTMGGNAEVQSGGVVQGATNITDTGNLVLAGTIENSLTVSGSGGIANITFGANVTGQTSVSGNGTLTTNGTLNGGLTANGGTVNTYSTGTTINSNNLTLTGNVALSATGSSVTTYGRITTPDVILTNATLSLGNVSFGAGETAYTLIDNTGSSPVSGTFNGLPEGSVIPFGGNSVQISYIGGPGLNNVMLYLQSGPGLSTEVNTNSDSTDPNDGIVTLREAVNHARLNALNTGANQNITFDASALFGGSNANTITLSSGTDYGVLSVNQNSTLSIIGPAVNTANSLTVSGNGTSGIFNLATATNLSNLTLSNANTVHGAAIYNNATTSLTDLTVMDNNATDGAGIYNAGSGQLTITRSTFANNTASTHGGAIDNNGGNVTLISTTIAYNNAANGGGINNISGNVTLLNTIVANNTGSAAGPDVEGTITANYSLIGNATDAVISGSDNLANVTALLGSLDYWGGTTKVFPLLPGSPAIDSGTGTGVTDQRGITVAGAADMGSFQSRGFNITKTGGGDEVTMIGDAFPTNLTLNITSSYSEPVTGGVISFTFANSTGGGTSANGTGFTAATSQATIVQNANVSDGNITLTAVANANYSNETYTALGNATGANAAASYVMTNVGTPDLITITNGDYQSGPLTGNFGQTLAINVKDSVGNNIPRLTVTFTPQTTAYGATGNVAGAGDGVAHSAVTDASGNIAGLSYASNGIGGLVTVVANATVASNSVRPAGTALENFHEGALGLNVQGGLTGRSFVNSVAAVLGNASLATDLINANSIRVMYLGLDGTSTAVDPNNFANQTLNVTGNNATLGYGSLGIGGDNNSDLGDGIYQLEVDYTNSNFANPTQVTTVKFHRLFGDVNGDRVVDTLDYRDVLNRSVYGRFGVYSQDTNGAGRVFSKDVTTTLRQRGRRVSNYNPYG